MNSAQPVPQAPSQHWAIYIRVSTQEQSREGVSLDAQEEKCRLALQLEQDGGDLPIKVYREEGESGKDMERPQMRELRQELEAGRLFGIVCFSLDRLSRSILDFLQFCELAEQHGVKIVSVSQRFDTSSPAGRLFVNILMSFAQFEREIITERIRNSVRHLRSQGNWTGGCTPYGYRLTRNDRHRCGLTPNDEQAKVIRRMFELVRDTRSLAATVRALRHEGFTRPAGQDFDFATVHRMIQNRTYLGEVAVKEVNRTTKETSCRWTKGQHEPLVTQELFDAVNKLVYRKSKEELGSKKTNRVFILQGLLYCSACRMGFTASYAHHNGRAKPYTFYYRCASAQKRRQEQAKCPFHNINADQIEQHVIKAIAAIADDHSGWLDEICQRLQTSAAPATAHLQTERQAILDEQRTAAKELDNALAFIKRAGTHAPKRLLNEITKLERKLDELTQELAEKDRGIAAAAPVRANPDELRAFFGRVGTLLEQATPEEQQELLQLFLQRIEVTKDGLVMHVYELPEGPLPPVCQKDMSSKTSPEWWAILDSNQ